MIKDNMKLIQIKRKTRLEKRFTPQMGRLHTKVTYIKKMFLTIIPLETLHKYRETYYGEIKDCEDCVLSK
tara:strand:- start:2992 stop:3201 length:210 start_codon:yes stop_codon:yes gene_type:complete